MKLNEEFSRQGLVKLSNLISEENCEKICQRIGRIPENRVGDIDKNAGDYKVSGEQLSHLLIDGATVAEFVPELEILHYSLANFVAQITDEQIVCGKYKKSDVNVLIYQKGSVKGAHYDTVPLSLVVFLTTHQNPDLEGAFYYKDLTGRENMIQPRAGDAVLFRGREIWHWVNELKREGRRIIVNANYYTAEDNERAAGIDDLLYA